MITYLLGKSSTGKFRFVIATLGEEWDNGFHITREYGQVGGKITTAPDLCITKGLSTRTPKEQALLKYNHIIKEYTDKAYKIVDKDPNSLTLEELDSLYGSIKMRGGTVKPMLAKQESQITNRKIFDDRDWYGSRKINGVRCLIFKDGNRIRTASRGAMDYDIAIIHIIQHPLIVKFFKEHPDAILDGEIYKRGWTLNKISGICRSQKTINDGKDLEFYWYDIVDLEKDFSERYKIMKSWKDGLKLSEFDPDHTLFNDDDLHIRFVPHIRICGFENMKKLHDEYVRDGWEGLVVRQAKSKYKPGSRSNDWVKIKEYHDAEYPIVGIAEGLRPEDMCFILETPSGQSFKCKPMGDRDQKQWYIDHIEDLIFKNLTIKYFEMSGVEGSEIPQQPIGIAIRDYE